MGRASFPVYFPVTRESPSRDGFAPDCLLQRRVMQTIGSSAAEPSLSSLGFSVAEQRRTKRRRGPHVVGARSRCEGKISSGRLARASGGAIRRACASALAARFEQISNATVRWCAPKDSGGAKPMIEVFAVWTTFFPPKSRRLSYG